LKQGGIRDRKFGARAIGPSTLRLDARNARGFNRTMAIGEIEYEAIGGIFLCRGGHSRSFASKQLDRRARFLILDTKPP